MAESTESQSRVKKYAPVGVLLALIGAGISLANSYAAEVMTTLGYERRTVTDTVWVSPWWMDTLSLAVLLVIAAVVFYAPAIMPRGGFDR